MGLFKIYNEKPKLLPPEYRVDGYSKINGETSGDFLKERLIIDYIAGMMDSYAFSTYEKFMGAAEVKKLF